MQKKSPLEVKETLRARLRRGALIGTVGAVAGWLCLTPALRAFEIPPLPDRLPFDSTVKDPVFAILVGLVQTELFGTLDREHLAQELEMRKAKSPLPYRELRTLTRLPVMEGSSAEITVDFDHDIDLPIPYSILGYHPGGFKATQTCVFHEWILGTIKFQHAYKEGGVVKTREVTVDDAHLFALSQGTITIDVDAWVDRLLGGALDDTDVKALLVFRYQDKWTGLATGYAVKDHSGRSGAFDFTKDSIMFPGPDEMKTIGRTMRKRSEEWAAFWPSLPALGNGTMTAQSAGARMTVVPDSTRAIHRPDGTIQSLPTPWKSPSGGGN